MCVLGIEGESIDESDAESQFYGVKMRFLRSQMTTVYTGFLLWDYLDIHLINLLSELCGYIKKGTEINKNKLRSSHYLTWRFLTILIHMCVVKKS